MIHNVHERALSAPVADVGRLVDSLASDSDRLWPTEQWPPMRLDRSLGIGARGGHGPIRYRVEEYAPGARVRFRFEAPAGFDGYHEYVVARRQDGGTVLRHLLAMEAGGMARLSWPSLYRPLHDALIEDSLDKASRSLGLEVSRPQRWGWRVRYLRAIAGRARRRRSPRRSAG